MHKKECPLSIQQNFWSRLLNDLCIQQFLLKPIIKIKPTHSLHYSFSNHSDHKLLVLKMIIPYISLMIKVKKAFVWLFGNFSSTIMFCWLPLLTVQDFLNTDDPYGWDYGIAILIFVAFALNVSHWHKYLQKKNS